jgi:hypothetical protein
MLMKAGGNEHLHVLLGAWHTSAVWGAISWYVSKASVLHVLFDAEPAGADTYQKETITNV